MRSYLCLMLLVTIQGWPTRLEADGAFVWHKGADLHEPSQKALLCWRGGKETLVLQVKYEGPAEEFAWIVPLPSKPEITAIKPAKSPFAEISLYTQRRQRWGYRGKTPSARAPDGGVTVLERKVVGVYDVATLAASDSGSLTEWLTQNGYAFPDKHKTVLDHYTKKSWIYVAMRIDPRQLHKNEVKKLHTGELQPVRFVFKSKEMVYPLKISSINAGKTEVLLYLLADVPMVPRKGERGVPDPEGFARPRFLNLGEEYIDSKFGFYRKARQDELPLTWAAIKQRKTTRLHLVKFRRLYLPETMTDDLTFHPLKPLPKGGNADSSKDSIRRGSGAD